jgi:hypothetical protein
LRGEESSLRPASNAMVATESESVSQVDSNLVLLIGQMSVDERRIPLPPMMMMNKSLGTHTICDLAALCWDCVTRMKPLRKGTASP